MTPTKIKPGTARRMGLRPPTPHLHGLIRVPPAISDEQFEAFKKAFEDGHKSGRWEVLRVDEPPTFRPPVRRRLGLKWWQREAR